jgi:hypothetical protein
MASQNSKVQAVYSVHPFSAIKPYTIGIILLILGFHIFSMSGSTVTSFDISLFFGLLILVPIVYFISLPRMDIYGITKIALAVLIVLTPFLLPYIGIEPWLPFDLDQAWNYIYGQIYSIFELISQSTPVSSALAGISAILGAVILLGASQSTIMSRVAIIGDVITVDQLFPRRKLFEMDIRGVDDVKISQSGSQRLFGYGLVSLLIKNRVIDLGALGRPNRFREFILNRINALTKEETKKPVLLESQFIARTLTPKSECPVCTKQLLDPKRPSELMVCPHSGTMFHNSCLNDWLKEAEACPLCGVPLESIEVQR